VARRHQPKVRAIMQPVSFRLLGRADFPLLRAWL